MQFIQRTRWLLGERRRSLQRIRAATEFLMRHMGLEGHCECAWSSDERERLGLLLRIETIARVPWAEREHFQTYFRRKLGQLRELGRLDDWDFQLVIVDAEDRQRRLESRQEPVSSRRIAAIVRDSNQEQPPEPKQPNQPEGQSLAEFRASVHRHWSQFRQSRPLRDSEQNPAVAERVKQPSAAHSEEPLMAMTELSPLS